MLVSFNISREANEYFKDYNLSEVADVLLEMFDYTQLPQITRERAFEKRINVSNESYISLYNVVGPRSKKISLGRLFEFAYDMDVLSMSRFDDMKRTDNTDNPTIPLLEKAYKTLLLAQKHDKSSHLKDITLQLHYYKEILKCQQET